jgi:8-oxo-dGTP pyrophosphatase MutT (NUDIX family)
VSDTVPSTHPDVARVERALAAHRPVEAIAPGARRAAVALLLRPGVHGLELCFIRRAERTGDPWSGHVAFPGGREEAGDETLEHTAVRETLEETGVDVRAGGRVLGSLDDLAPRTPSLPPVVVRPFVAVVPAGTEVVPNDGEVAGAFWVPLRTLYLPETTRESTVTVRGQPVVVTSFRHDDHVIWGMTERILRQLLELAAA